MSREISPYYPPRARWYAPLFYAGGALRRRVALDRIQSPGLTTWRALILSLLLPGYGFYCQGPRILGLGMIGACAILFSIFIVWLGYPAANLAFGLIVSIHASGIAYYCGSFLNKWEFMKRILFTVGILMFLGFLIYSPLRALIQDRWVMPIRSGGQVIILERQAVGMVHRGDHIAYKLPGYYFSNHFGQGVSQGNGGLSFGQVIAVAGDRVKFSPEGFSVNGVRRPPLPHMPASGAWTVPRNHWFIWPNLAISGNWNVSEGNISAAMLQLSNVSEDQFVAKALNRWLWRKQF